MTDKPAKCPKCGTIRGDNRTMGDKQFLCGSIQYVPGAFEQSDRCRIAELTQQLAESQREVERLKRAVDGLVENCENWAERNQNQRQQLAEVERLKRQLIGEAVDKMPDGTTLIKTAKLDELKQQLADSQRDKEHALNEAKRRCPDYPWSQNTMAEVVWALGESYSGAKAACEDLHKQLADRDRQIEEAIRVIRRCKSLCVFKSGVHYNEVQAFLDEHDAALQ